MLNGLYSHSCPYGQMRREEGYTKAARRCGDLIRKRKEEYGDVAHSKGDLKFLCYIGDYVFLPLPHLINYSNSIRDKNFFKGDGDIIKKEDFTPEFIVELIKYRPEALMGGEITSYQKKEVPKFCNQLKRYMSDMYEKVKTIYPEIEDRIEDIDYRDKMAKVVTLLPGKVKLSTKILEWDGSVIKAEGNQLTFWGLSRETVIITLDENTYVQIVDNATVTEIKQIGRVLGLPDDLIDKVPSDGLCGKTDEDNLGFTYDALDRYIRTGEIEDGEVKKRIDTMHEKNLFKLQLMPSFQP